MVKEIPISNRDLVALVDDRDYELLKGYKWCLYNGKYAGRNTSKEEQLNGAPTTIYMHREVMSAVFSKNTVDHINGKFLDNRKSNLRLCSQGLNNLNRPPRADNKCGYKGVRYKKSRKSPWDARIQLDGKRAFLGYFDNPHDAARMYNFWAADIFGEYAYLNVIKEEEINYE